jgi:hypothetical protein
MPPTREPPPGSLDNRRVQTDDVGSRVEHQITPPHRHSEDRCYTCCGWPTGLTVADEWRRWALDFGHTIGSRRERAA